MGQTPAERQRLYQQRKKARWAEGPQVACACGCGTLIPVITKGGKPARFAHGHNARVEEIGQRFVAGQEAWNKGQPALWAIGNKHAHVLKGRPGRPLSTETKVKLALAHKGKTRERPEQCMARKIDSASYVLIYKPDHPRADKKGFVQEHRLVMEQLLGRFLLPTEYVHHKNHQRQDNREENLMIVTKSEHSRIHSRVTGGVLRMTFEQRSEAGRKGAQARWGNIEHATKFCPTCNGVVRTGKTIFCSPRCAGVAKRTPGSSNSQPRRWKS